MPLYKLTGKLLESVKSDSFAKEKDLQSLVEANLQSLFGLDFVTSEYQIGNLRIDTLAFDKEAKSFVVIEFKRGQNFSVVDQGMSYLSLVLNNKADVVLEYNERCNQSLKKDKVDWSQLRVLFVSDAFTTYQTGALGFKDLPIELWQVSKFDKSLLMIDKIKTTSASASIITISKKSSTFKEVTKEVKPYTEEMHIKMGNPNIQALYAQLRELVLALSPDIFVKPTKVYVGFKAKSNVTDVVVLKKALKVFINLGKGSLNDPKGLAKDISKIGHWGNGDYEVLVAKEDELQYVISLVSQSFTKNR